MATSAITTRPAPAGIAWECGSMLLQSTQPLRKHRTLNSTAGGRAQAKAWVCSNAHSTMEVDNIITTPGKETNCHCPGKGLLLEKMDFQLLASPRMCHKNTSGFQNIFPLAGFLTDISHLLGISLNCLLQE